MIELEAELLKRDRKGCEVCGFAIKELKQLHKRIAELESQGQWVSVEDRLPDNDREVEVAHYTGVCMCRSFAEYRRWRWWSGDYLITGWTPDYWKEAAPLPIPPSEDKK